MIDKDFLRQTALEMGIELSESQLERFAIYGQELVSYNEKVNLTAITDPEGIAIKHFVDSIALNKLYEIPHGASLADVGTGAGFPSLPLGVVRPDLKITLIDSLAKRITFLQLISKLLGQKNTTIHARAEQAGIDPKLREKFDVVTARAVAELRVLCEYCLPFVKVGGVLLALKGPDCGEEIGNAANAVSILGGGELQTKEYTLPDGSGRTLVIIKKLSPTPAKYPRQRVKLNEKPL